MELARTPLHYDPEANTAYLQLTGGADVAVARRVELDPWTVGGVVGLDFDEAGHLVGVQISDANDLLRSELLHPLPTQKTADAHSEPRIRPQR